MKIKGLMIVAVTALLLASNSKGADSTWNDRFRYERDSTTKFMPNEFSLDLFGTYATRDRYGHGDDNWGGGLGVNYFFTRYIGIGADSYLEEWKTPYRANGSLIFRIPIDAAGIAPYAFGGGGRQWKYVPQWTAHAGGGLEIRFNPNFGLFADGRRVFPDKSKDYALWRAGVKFAF